MRNLLKTEKCPKKKVMLKKFKSFRSQNKSQSLLRPWKEGKVTLMSGKSKNLRKKSPFRNHLLLKNQHSLPMKILRKLKKKFKKMRKLMRVKKRNHHKMHLQEKILLQQIKLNLSSNKLLISNNNQLYNNKLFQQELGHLELGLKSGKKHFCSLT